MSFDDLPPPEVMWAGKFVRAIRRGKWEYASRTNNIGAVVILAEHDGKVILIDQPRVPLGRRCIELPAGLVGDEDPNATIEGTAIKELEEETGFTADRVERLGEFYASPGMVSEGFTLVRATGVRKIGRGRGRRKRGHQRPPRRARGHRGVHRPQAPGGVRGRRQAAAVHGLQFVTLNSFQGPSFSRHLKLRDGC